MDLRAGLANARCPVLVLAGELDPVMPVESCQEVVDGLPRELVQFEVLAGLSHNQVGRDCPALREFILGPS
jgi:pimeloyl-ACP methyl ester carboxylesterase